MRHLIRAVLLLTVVGRPTGAAAEPACEPLSEADMIALVLSGQAAVDRGNPDTHRGIVREIRSRVPCLTFAPPARLLADYLVLEALAAFSQQQEWKAPLITALALRPGVDRGVGPAHPMARFEPQVATEGGRAVPEGVTLYVDGETSARVPPPGPTHLVQVTSEGRWRSALFTGSEVPEAFLVDPIQVPLTVSPWGHVALVVGPGGAVQRRGEQWPDSAGQNDTVPDRRWLTAWPAAVARGGVTYGRIGLQGDVDIGLAGLARPVGSHAQAAATLRIGPVWTGLGAGVGGSATAIAAGPGSLTDPQYAWSVTPLAYGYVTAGLRRDAWDGEVTVGAGPAARRGTLRAAVLRPLTGTETPLRIGAAGVIQQGRFEEDQPGGKAVDSVTWRAGIELGLGR